MAWSTFLDGGAHNNRCGFATTVSQFGGIMKVARDSCWGLPTTAKYKILNFSEPEAFIESHRVRKNAEVSILRPASRSFAIAS
jgi:hypothetical protein